nr:meiotic nuclear division protein 1 homolog isoform X4 [Peromyscus maniculatus bairdii]XP_042135145.1 meiotic nuclear division protein 1 homolog isoform X4 [Peromyscus maniculatus bairdii]XP_042135146.1 meiotic nuclear division protein 1 homolog isoform X4 [Peromyscus maniculatus bairdii]
MAWLTARGSEPPITTGLFQAKLSMPGNASWRPSTLSPLMTWYGGSPYVCMPRVWEELSEGSQKHANLQKSIEKARIGRQETEERAMLVKELSSFRNQRDQLKAEVEKYRECDPQVVEEIRQANKVAKEAANRWTDNIFAIKSWAKRKFGFEENKIDKNFGIPEDFDYID